MKKYRRSAMLTDDSKRILVHFSLLFKITVLVFLTLSITFTIAAFALASFHLIPLGFLRHIPYLFILLVSILLGTVIASVAARVLLRPYKELVKAINKIEAGDFSARVLYQGEPEITFLADRFNSMVDELQKMEIMRSDFVSNVSHEFKTPVNSIKGFAKFLKEDIVTSYLTAEERLEYINIILKESERLSSMSGNILLLSKLEGQESLGECKLFSLDEQIRQSLVMLEGQLAKKNINLTTELAEQSYNGNAELLYQVWINIIGNAIKFTEEGGTIDIRLEKGEDTKVWISDTGIGMDSNTVRHIFDKFYQGDTSHAVEGNGLGMALVKRIVSMHRGRVTVESQLGKGSRVCVILPPVAPLP